ncbi:unnamed protein product [Rotaria sp. Silwood1]|nr:unnamed protein product [Rotaria sp. Silwood1]CAF4987921.1 unnamed protein product [Rotaria sp. Silwood1]
MIVNMLNLFVLFSFCLISINGHGYLFEPVARSSAWLVDPSFKKCCTYSGHMEMFCGGVGHQWNTNGGKCGICGEPYDRAVKLFEKGGAMYTGKIVQTYIQGQQIDVKVKLSANHHGYFEFRLCNVDDNSNSDATQECLDHHLLTIANTDSTKYRDIAKHGSEMITVRIQLPLDIACQHCVFQWKYTTGNNWGRDPTTNKSGPGLGRENETFMGCSDITILANSPTTTLPPIIISPTTTMTTTSSSTSKYRSVLSPKHWSILSTTTTTTTTMTMATTNLSSWSSLLIAYQRGDDVMYNGIKYRCVTSHRSYAGAEPSPLTWALWRKIE